MRLTWYFTIVVVALSPFLLSGSVPQTALVFASIALMAGFFATASKLRTVDTGHIISLTLPFMLIESFLVFQIIPLSPDILCLFSPQAGLIYQETIWQISPGLRMPLSTNIEATVFAICHIAALWSLCLSLGLLIDNHLCLFQVARATALIVILWAFTTALILAGGGSEKLLTSYLREVVSLEKARIAAAAWFVATLPVLLAFQLVLRRNQPRCSLKKILNDSMCSLRAVMFFSVAVGLLSILLLREYVLWVAVLLCCLLLITFDSSHSEKHSFVNFRVQKVASFASIALLVGWLAFALWFSHNSMIIGEEHLAVLSYKPFTLLGFGVGAANDLLYATAQATSGKIPVAIGTFTAWWVGGGVLGAVLFFVCIFSICYISTSGKDIGSHDSIVIGLYPGALSGLLLTLVIGLLFPLITWQAASVMIVCMATMVTCILRVGEASGRLQQARTKGTPLLPLAVCIVLFLATTASSMVATTSIMSRFIADALVPTAALTEDLGIDARAKMGRRLEVLERVAPYDSAPPLVQSYIYLINDDMEKALAAGIRALSLRPLSAETHIALAVISACKGNKNLAGHFLATRATNSYIPDEMTEYLMTRLLSLPDTTSAVDFMKIVLYRSPDKAGYMLNLLKIYGIDQRAIHPDLPSHPLIYLAIGDFNYTEGHLDAADKAYRAAIYSKAGGEGKDASIYLRTAKYFAETGRTSEALVIANAGLEANPMDFQLGLLAEGIQKEIGLHY